MPTFYILYVSLLNRLKSIARLLLRITDGVLLDIYKRGESWKNVSLPQAQGIGRENNGAMIKVWKKLWVLKLGEKVKIITYRTRPLYNLVRRKQWPVMQMSQTLKDIGPGDSEGIRLKGQRLFLI